MRCKFIKDGDNFVCENCGRTTTIEGYRINCAKKPPNIVQRGVNFAKATAKHVATGFRHCTPEQKKERYDKCSKNECGLFLIRGSGGICSHDDCGCYIRSQGQFFDKLSWADSKCPEGYWGPIDKKDQQTP